jgi:hypothetical protein
LYHVKFNKRQIRSDKLGSIWHEPSIERETNDENHEHFGGTLGKHIHTNEKKNMVPGQYYTKGVTLEEIAIICHLSKPKHQTSQGFCI